MKIVHDQLKDQLPMSLGTTEWVPIDQGQIDGFAEATGDRQWIHVDPGRAAEGPFGRTIAHGYLVLSMVPRLLHELLEITDQGMSVNYGTDRVRFTAPVPVGSHLRLKATITNVADRGDGLQVRLSVEVELRDSDRPALVGDISFLTYPRT